MPYAVRNSIVLAVLILLVNSIGWFALVMPTRKQEKKIQAELATLDANLARDANLYSLIEKAHNDLSEMRKRWQSRPKILPRTEDTRISYKYLHSIVMRGKHPFPYDFDFEDYRDTLGMSSRKYSFRADVTFEQLFEFLHYFETNRRLMVILEMQMDAKPPREDERDAKEMVTLNTRMIAYAATNGTDEIVSSVEPPPHLFWDPFKSQVKERLPKNDENLLEVDHSKLVAIASNGNRIAFLQNQQGTLMTLKEGDEVYLGYVTKIDPPSATVEFTLNYGGFIRKRVLALVKEQMSPGQHGSSPFE